LVLQGEIHPQGLNYILDMTLGPEHPDVLEAPDIGLLLPAIFINLVDVDPLHQAMRWWMPG